MNIVLCALTAIPDGGTRGFALPQAQLFAVRSGGDVSVYLNRCPHLGIPLNWQEDGFLDNEKAFIQCSTHGALFEKQSGLCIQGPCRGESLWQIMCSIKAGNVVIDDAELPSKTELPF
ncbi:MAG: Rieske 2Fe-2S domain-containing protein [Pseudomonadota bacterium]